VHCHRCFKPLTGYQVKRKQLWYYKCNTIGCKLNVGAHQLHHAYKHLLAQYSMAPELIPPLKMLIPSVFEQLNQEDVQARQAVQTQLKQIERKLEKMEERYAEGELDRATYEKFSRKVRQEELESVQAEYHRLSSHLSNPTEYIDFAIEMAAQLPVMWENADLSTRHKLQKMIHPNGIAYSPETGLYRTGRLNTIFNVITSLSMSDKSNKTGSNASKDVQSGLVGPTGTLDLNKLPNKACSWLRRGLGA
jgi:site-specific DNA recombinase